MPVKSEREYRAVHSFECRSSEDKSYIVEGYASTFEPYLMYSFDGVDYYEQIMPNAFDEADMSDVIFQCDHRGAVMARTSNGTLMLNVDEHGLHQVTDLSKTAKAREKWEETKAGMYKEMSFAFVVAADHYDEERHTRVIDRIKKVYDVSVVSFGANPTTDISARSYFDGVIEMERQELSRRAAKTKKLKLLVELEKLK